MRKKRDVDLLKSRLDVYSDEWRTAQPGGFTTPNCLPWWKYSIWRNLLIPF